jgi:methionyl-tRNA formyltransferase
MTVLDGFLFLAAYSSRSQSYAQAMRQIEYSPERVLLFGNSDNDVVREVAFDANAGEGIGLFFPNLCEPLAATCHSANWRVETNSQDDVNHPEITEHIKAINPRYIIYSGYGGQLVKPHLLDLGIPFMHMHSGWLPEYGGSTTLYYSWLREGQTAVTALFLDKGIDTGPSIMRRRYPIPPPRIDVDHLYDGTIRADTLVHVLERFVAAGEFPTAERDGDPATYFVIHPVLKHLALLSRKPQQ